MHTYVTPEAFADVADALEALADPTRRSVFESLRDGPRAVGEIAGGMSVTRPAVSQHLRVLLDARLVTVDPDGARRLYRVRPDGLAAVRRYIEGFWGTVLDAYADAATQEDDE